MILLMGYAVARTDADDRVELISPKEASVMYTEKKAVIVDVREDSEGMSSTFQEQSTFPWVS